MCINKVFFIIIFIINIYWYKLDKILSIYLKIDYTYKFYLYIFIIYYTYIIYSIYINYTILINSIYKYVLYIYIIILYLNYKNGDLQHGHSALLLSLIH